MNSSIKRRLEALEGGEKGEPPCLLTPNTEGTYTAVDGFHRGQVYTEEQAAHLGARVPVIVLDVAEPIEQQECES